MRMSTAYFAGAGTVAAAVVVGIGGGLVIAEMMNPKSPVLEQTKFERRTANPTPQASNAPAPQASNPGGSDAGSSYLAATQAATNAAVVVAPAAAKAPETPAVEQANQSPSSPTPPSRAATAADTPQPSPESAQQRTGAPEKAFAKAQDSDVKPREAEARQRSERLRAERRQQWLERRQARRGRDQELRDVEQAVREDMPRREERPSRAYIAEPVEVETPQLRQAPQVRLFDDDN